MYSIFSRTGFSKKVVLKLVSALLVPVFLFTCAGISDAQILRSDNSSGINLAPYLITQLLRDFESKNEELQFKQEWFDQYADGLVAHMIKQAEEKNLRIDKTDLEELLIKIIKVRSEKFEIETDIEPFLERIRAAFRSEDTEDYRAENPKPGTMAGFGVDDLGLDKYGIDLHALFSEATRRTAPGGNELSIHEIIQNRNKENEVARFLQEHDKKGEYTLDNLRLMVIPGWISTFAEIYREELRKKNIAEPEREELVSYITSTIISHPGNYNFDRDKPGKKLNIYIDETFYKILTKSSNFPDEVDDLFIELLNHEIWHLTHQGPNDVKTEQEAVKAAPLNKVRRAIKKRTILVAQSGGDCAGLNTVTGTLAVEGPLDGWNVVGVKEGFKGVAAKRLKDYLMPIDKEKGQRIRYRPSTDLRSSRLNTFEVVDLIKFHKDEGAWKGSTKILQDLKEIGDWENRSDSDNAIIDRLRVFFRGIETDEKNKTLAENVSAYIKSIENWIAETDGYDEIKAELEEYKKDIIGFASVNNAKGMQDYVRQRWVEWLDRKVDFDPVLHTASILFAENISNLKAKKDYQGSIDNFVMTLQNLEGYGGLIVTGGDDHSRLAMTISEMTRGRIKCIAVPKSIDADAMVQMTGFRTAANHLRNRFWQAAITKVDKGKPRIMVSEIMGRKAGWLTLAASTRETSEFGVPEGYTASEFEKVKDTVLALVPEKPVTIRSIVLRAKEILAKKGTLNIACSEGFTIDDKNDPLYQELIDANPLLKAKLSGKPVRDEHGHLKLAGASDFVCAILATDWVGLGHEDLALDSISGWKDINQVIFGYIPRGLTPEQGYWDAEMAKRYVKRALKELEAGHTGLIIGYGDKDNPFDPDNEPGAYPATSVLTVGDQRFSRNLTTMGDEPSREVVKWRRQNTENDYSKRFRVYTNMMLREAGILMIDVDDEVLKELISYIEGLELLPGEKLNKETLSAKAYDHFPENEHGDELYTIYQEILKTVDMNNDMVIEDFREKMVEGIKRKAISEGKEVPLSFDLDDEKAALDREPWDYSKAVKEIRKDFISTAISSWAHKKPNVFEVPDNDGALTFAVADKAPYDYDDWSSADKASWEKISETIIYLLPGQEVSFAHLAERIVATQRKYGTVNIVVSTGYKLNIEDPAFRKALQNEEDAEVREKFLLTNKPETLGGGSGEFQVDSIAEIIVKTIEMNYPKHFKKGGIRFNKTGKAYNMLPKRFDVPGFIWEKMEKNIGLEAKRVRDDIENLYEDIEKQLLVYGDNTGNDKTTVYITKSLLENFTKFHDWGETLEAEYGILIKKLKRIFWDVVVIEGEGDIDIIKSAIRSDRKAVVLDNGSLPRSFIGDLETEEKAEYGKTFSMVSTTPVTYAAKGEIPFLNLHAMALLGASLMYDYYDGALIFDSAYKAFTGISPREGFFKSVRGKIEEGNKFVLTVVPRMVKLTTGLLDTKELRKLFSIAA